MGSPLLGGGHLGFLEILPRFDHPSSKGYKMFSIMLSAFQGHRCQKHMSDYLLFVMGTIAISRAYQLESSMRGRATGGLCAIVDGRSKIRMF